MLDRGNKIASVLTWIGVVIIVAGIIVGVVLGRENVGTYTETYEQVWSLTIIYWVTGLISGMCIIGLSEVIEQLHRINLKIGKGPEPEDDDLELLNG
ncbi:hypothetical protein [Paenibacillus sp. IHBB 10380]|uniref:hypothetical protein n=1 Tax=Paenibacillus sp. IHBB 10380 TaxID=1566358 RepID=UPI0005CFCF29|nr:hypothetical protein [Paenibacillus sp. IHBB 10380]AJS61197.1 hypothetical protein UB51_25270 [Paenibacillus sp. IHBB 10380]